ncbi:amidohydrolase family protein [Terrabacter sp. GCM10028922]|uniref:amidohydrolase family protein n=1 Tax=Terrabacter sp. GCM10028922 TaxID=3273428 RepID=UPI003621336C
MEVLRAGQVFDGERFLGATDIAIDDGTVVDVGPPGAYASDVTVEELGDVTVLPGLVDAHQHLTWDCSTDPLGWHRESDDEALLERGRANARRALAAGVTTVRELGGRGLVTVALRDELARDPSSGPMLLVAGPALTTPGGHCWFLGGECADEAALRAAVARLAAAGVDVVKVMATGGTVTPGSAPHESQFGVAELRAVVESAHAAGLPVAAHAHGTSGVADAVTAGVDTIEHVSFMTADGIAQDPDLVARLAASGLPLSITGGTVPGPLRPEIAIRLPALLEHLRGLVASGANCLFSTDAGIGPPKPHDVMVHGVTQLVSMIGLPTDRALAMCTSLPAKALGIADRAGRLAPGMPADVLVVAGRADEDVEAMLRPERVLHAGIIVADGRALDSPV